MSRYRRQQRAWRCALVSMGVVAVLGVTGCDPCAGVVACEGEPAARVSGRIVRFPSLVGVGGVRLTVAANGLQRTVTTDGDGFWSVALDSDDGSGRTTTASIAVQGPDGTPGYQVEGVPLAVSRRRGDGVDVGRWYDQPQLRFIGEMRPRAGVDLRGATVRLERTGGVESDVEVLDVPITADRRFLAEAPARGVGEMEFRMTISGPSFPRSFVQEGVRARTMYRDTAAGVQGTYSVGAGFPYVVRVFRRGNDEPLAGVAVTFVRTSGPVAMLDSVRSTTDAEGYAAIRLQPVVPGEVVGTLTLRRSGLPPAEYVGIRLATVDDDDARLAGNFAMGVQVASVVELYRRTSFTPLAGTAWTFTPTAGPLSAPLTGVTDLTGVVGIRAPVGQAGTVRGDLAVQYLPPRAPEVLRNITLVAAADDSVRRGGYLGVGPSLLYIGTLQDLDGFAPIIGATAEFRRTGGVPVTDSVYRWVTNEIGVFRMSSAPLADGEVVGDLTFRMPAPYRDTTYTGIRLQTFTADTNRAGPIFRVRRP